MKGEQPLSVVLLLLVSVVAIGGQCFNEKEDFGQPRTSTEAGVTTQRLGADVESGSGATPTIVLAVLVFLAWLFRLVSKTRP